MKLKLSSQIKIRSVMPSISLCSYLGFPPKRRGKDKQERGGAVAKTRFFNADERGDGGTLPCRAFPVFEIFSAPVFQKFGLRYLPPLYSQCCGREAIKSFAYCFA